MRLLLTVLIAMRLLFAFSYGWWTDEVMQAKGQELMNELMFFISAILVFWYLIPTKDTTNLIMGLSLLLVEFVWILDDLRDFVLYVTDEIFKEMFPVISLFGTVTLVILLNLLFTPKHGKNGT